MKTFYSYAILLFFLTFNSPKTVAQSPFVYSEDPKIDIPKIFKPGKFIVEMLDINPEFVALQLKLTLAMSKDAVWYYQYESQYPKGTPVPYDERINMPKDEFEKLQKLKANPEFISKGTTTIKIMKSKGKICFKSSEKLDLLNKVQILVDSNIIKIDGHRLTFTSKMSDNTGINAYKSTWRGYKYDYILPLDLIGKSFEEIKKMTMKSYTFIVGKIDNTGKTFLDINESEMQGGHIRKYNTVRITW